jgi:hypothetical protein
LKIIAFFVPQFHRIPLNDQYWGEGFTEWNNVRNAKPVFKGHVQPKVPLNNNYYNLLDDNTKKWQMELAKKYGIYGFCYYHYWFNGNMLLEQPCEQILKNTNLDLPFCFSWANEAWTMAWGGKRKVIMRQFYGGENEWVHHFNYLLPFFKDERYIRIGGKPLFVIYRPEVIDCLEPMLSCWRKLAVMNGLPGIQFANQSITYTMQTKNKSNQIDYDIEFEPMTSKSLMLKKYSMLVHIRSRIVELCEKKLGLNLKNFGNNFLRRLTNTTRLDYDDAWRNILTRPPISNKSIPCAFTNWDNSPRYKNRALIYIGATTTKFRKLLLL